MNKLYFNWASVPVGYVEMSHAQVQGGAQKGQGQVVHSRVRMREQSGHYRQSYEHFFHNFPENIQKIYTSLHTCIQTSMQIDQSNDLKGSNLKESTNI